LGFSERAEKAKLDIAVLNQMEQDLNDSEERKSNGKPKKITSP
jgi:hypothetical protein